MRNTIYLLLGSNQGDPAAMLTKAEQYIQKQIGLVRRKSSLYQTAAWGYADQPDFLNQVIIVESAMSARETLAAIFAIEETMGRVRTVKNAPRIIDIDILFFNTSIVDEEQLVIPHPAIPIRRFVLIPLNELSPGLQHPALQKTVQQLLLECPDTLDVKKI